MPNQTTATVASWRPQTFFSHRIETAGQIERLNAEGGIAVRFRPLGRAGAAFTFVGGQSAALSLWRTASRSGFVTTPQIDVDVITVRFVTRGVMLRHDHRREHVGRPGWAMMVMFDAMRDEEASEGFEALSGTITRQALVAGHMAFEGEAASAALPDFEPIVEMKGLPLQALMLTMDRVHGQLRAGVSDSDLLFPLLEEIMVYQLLSAWPRRAPGTLWPRSASGAAPLRRAQDYIDGHIAQKLLLSDVAGAAGVGVRRLQLIFRGETGKTPLQFILERRLDRVHADLRTSSGGGASVGTVAARWGFTHMGDFGRRYRARFGEAPSLTRRSPPSARG